MIPGDWGEGVVVIRIIFVANTRAESRVEEMRELHSAEHAEGVSSS